MKAKGWVVLGIIVVALVVALGAFVASHKAEAAVGALNIYAGGATVVRGGTSITGANGTAIDMNDTITVPAGSRASIILKDGTEVRLEGGTTVTVTDSVIELASGKAWSHVSPLAAGATFKVETPTVVATVRGTDFDVSYDGATSDVYVDVHTVWVALNTNPANEVAVSAGNEITIRDATAAADLAAGPHPANPTDDWTIFNTGLNGGGAASTTAPTSTATTPPAPTKTKPAPSKPAPTPTPSSTTAQTVVLKSLTVAAQNDTPTQNDVDPLTVTATYSDGSTANVTSNVTWSLKPALNIIDAESNLHCTFTGLTTITATLQGVTSNALEISVNPQPQQQAPQQQPGTFAP